ncbi:MAG: tRNA pseudouridine(38-40) synthase TruA, partial [Bacteroidota bacterium]
MNISYKGTHYHGWQIQPNGKTIQGEIEKGLSLLLREQVAVTGSGRTDTGVHATQQVAHFEYHSPLNTEDIAYKLNSYLAKDICINQIVQVEDDLHARFNASRRTYFYHIHQKKHPFKQETSYYYHSIIDVELID